MIEKHAQEFQIHLNYEVEATIFLL